MPFISFREKHEFSEQNEVLTSLQRYALKTPGLGLQFAMQALAALLGEKTGTWQAVQPLLKDVGLLQSRVMSVSVTEL